MNAGFERRVARLRARVLAQEERKQAEQEQQPKLDPDTLTKAQLVEIADQAGIDVNNRMTKAEIIERLEGGE